MTHGIGKTQLDIAAGDHSIHQASGETQLECLQGCVKVNMGGRAVEMCSGATLALEPGVAHRIDAVKNSQLLMTVQQEMPRQEEKIDLVEEASLESFPASDPPA